MIRVPQNYVLIEQGPLTLMLRQDYRERLLQCGISNPENLCSARTRTVYAGRGPMPSLALEPGSDERIVVRHYRRGGLIRFFNPDIYVDPQRSFDELAITLRAAQAAVPVATVVAAASLRVLGPLYRHYLVSLELQGCCDLPVWFQERDAESGEIEALARNAAERVRHMHDSGFYHGDLNLRNILVSRADERRLFIIDWDKSTYTPGVLSLDDRHRNVLRLCRSVEKLRKKGVRVPETFMSTFLEHYWQNPDLVGISRRALARTLERRAIAWRFLR